MMGKRGPKPKPVEQRIAEGNPAKRALPPTPAPPDGGMDAPVWLTPRAADVWREIAPRVHRMGLLRETDHELFGAWCESAATVRECARLVAERGSFVETDTGELLIAPWQSLFIRAKDQSRKLGAGFGLTPSDRVGLGAVTPREDSKPSLLSKMPPVTVDDGDTFTPH